MLPIKQRTGMRGVFLVAAELSKNGYSVALTARNAAGADLMIFSTSKAKAQSIEVKTNAKKNNYWLLSERGCKMSSETHYYAFLNISEHKDGCEQFDYYIVPSDIVSSNILVEKRKNSTWYSFSLNYAKNYKDKWSVLGKE